MIGIDKFSAAGPRVCAPFFKNKQRSCRGVFPPRIFFSLSAVLFLLVSFRAFSQQGAQSGAQQGRPGADAPVYTPASPVTGGADLNALNAAGEFRIGVQAYYRYAFNEAILSFERALSFRPGEAIILDWLGKAYYRSGLEETALMQWRSAAAAYGWNSGQGMLLGTKIETVANRRFLFPVADDEVRYVESGRYPGHYEGYVLYRQPSAVLPVEDGSVWVVAYGSNEIVRIGVNGVVKDRKRGPLNGFDRPYDLVKGSGGRFYLSEYRGGRVSILNDNGDWQAYIGSKGLGDGMFMGPQNMTVDEQGYLYVVDYGNRRISKFDPDGAFILSFGLKDPYFPGFLSPTGIAAGGDRIYAADAAAKRIYMFDPNGSYLGILVEEGLAGPESLRFLSDGRILAADTNRVLLVDPDSAIVRELGVAGSSRVRIVGADMDRNGNILAANFAADEVSVLTRFDDLASGLFVQIERVSAENFPLVTVELSVEDRLRRPIVGLEGINFLLSEQGKAAGEQSFMSPAYLSNRTDVSVLVERSPATKGMRDDLAAAARDINNALAGEGSVVSLVSAGEQPERERLGGTLEAAARGNTASYSPRWRFDLGLRLAASDLLAGEKKRALVYVGSGNTGELAFERYGLSELAAYLANNGIVFHAVITGGGAPSGEIRYLCRETGGEALPLYRPRGIGDMIRSIAARPSGTYMLSYRSQLPTEFGRAYLPVEAEVYLMERSGRDSSGYFPPLE
ncbi:MAG: NHL repeat-containing protein [Treponema sp.]|jgi:DNA-binding beta-propeller fold protein YncE|nr:NHL repeat-containing protein [Treponema sp.]